MEDKALYFECGSGISGDMAVAAMLDLGADEDVLKKVLETVPVKGFHVEIKNVYKSSIRVRDFNVVLDDGTVNHDHDMEYLHGSLTDSDRSAGHDSSAAPDSSPDSGNDKYSSSDEHNLNHEHHHHHIHRNLADVKEIINGTRMESGAKELAIRIFTIVAEAESEAHGVPVDQVHFHEVGALDSIVDIISMAVCLEDLKKRYGVNRVIIKELLEGNGTVRCMHGVLPVPVPAVLNIVSKYGVPLSIMRDVEGEFVTPTGAAFAAAVSGKNDHVLPERFLVLKWGLGGGKREYSRPSILRAFLISYDSQDLSGANAKDEGKYQYYHDKCGIVCSDVPDTGLNPYTNHDTVILLETNIDDSTGENLGFVQEKLFKQGALDVFMTPVYMKKNRPACKLSVICRSCDVLCLEDIIFTQTTSTGVRRTEWERDTLERRDEAFSTAAGEMHVKLVSYKGTDRFYPEYESVKLFAEKTDKSFREAYREISEHCRTIPFSLQKETDEL